MFIDKLHGKYYSSFIFHPVERYLRLIGKYTLQIFFKYGEYKDENLISAYGGKFTNMTTNNFIQNKIHRKGNQNIERPQSGSAVVVSEAKGMFSISFKGEYQKCGNYFLSTQNQLYHNYHLISGDGTNDNENGGGSDVGIMVGVAFLSVFFIVIISLCGIYCRKRY